MTHPQTGLEADLGIVEEEGRQALRRHQCNHLRLPLRGEFTILGFEVKIPLPVSLWRQFAEKPSN